MKLNYLVPAALVLLFLSSSPSTAKRPPLNTTVLDSEGRELQSGMRYYALPVQIGSIEQGEGEGGGLALSSRPDRKCPFYVMQEIQHLSNGLPLRFVVPSRNINRRPAGIPVSLSTDVNIVFSAATTCVQSTAWRVGSVDEVTGQRYVVSGGVTGRPGPDTVSNWFKIEKYGNESSSNSRSYIYKIVFCPSVCTLCKIVCGDVGIFVEGGKRWLGLSEEPLLLMFSEV